MMPRLLITSNYPVQKLERISIYDDPATQKTSNGTCLSRTDLGESLVTDIPIGNLRERSLNIGEGVEGN